MPTQLSQQFETHAFLAMLGALITRHPTNRLTASSLPSHSFFSSLPISTLNFLDRSNFAAKTREEKISFMKGLTNVLDRFSEGLRVRKVLPSLLEEVGVHFLRWRIVLNVFFTTDERFTAAPLYPSKCFRNFSGTLANPIRHLGVTKPKTTVCDQRPTPEHVDPPEQCENSAGENREAGVP